VEAESRRGGAYFDVAVSVHGFARTVWAELSTQPRVVVGLIVKIGVQVSSRMDTMVQFLWQDDRVSVARFIIAECLNISRCEFLSSPTCGHNYHHGITTVVS
jgi:hypothetical protein